MKQYDLRGCRVHVGAPVEVGRGAGHFWFATIHPLSARDILCCVVRTADRAQGEWPALICLSRDGGASWREACEIESYGPASTLLGPRELLLMPYETWPDAPGDRRSARARGTVLTLQPDGSVAARRTPVRFLGWPRDLAPYHEGELCLLTNGNVLPRGDGLLTTLYGQFDGDKRYTCFAATSDDGSATWRYLSMVAGPDDVPGAPEGPDESNIARLPDGSLLCVYRVGSGTDHCYHASRSADDGASWGRPERLEGCWSVEPQLVRLEGGLLLLSGGRQGLFLWACADGEGRRWERINLAAHHNALCPDPALRYSDDFCRAGPVDPPQSTSYTCMKAVGPDEALVCYDRLANGWSPAPGPWSAQSAVFCVRVRAGRP